MSTPRACFAGVLHFREMFVTLSLPTSDDKT